MTPERLAEIRANDALVRGLHGNGWDDHATDAEIDRSDLLAEFGSVGAERDALKAELAEARAAIAEVRRLCNLTIAASCRVQAIAQAEDTLAVLDRALDAPQRPEGTRERAKHIGGRANAEDCPACHGTNPPYPFICPGEPESPEEGNER